MLTQVLRSFFLKDLSETVWHTSIHILTTIRASWRRLYIRVEYDGKTSNLLSRQRNSNPKETFGYDKLDRLVSVNTSGNTTMNISYATNGNILSKTGVGNYEYDGNVRPHAVTEVENRDGSIPLDELQTRYNDFGKVEWLSLQKNSEGVDVSFVYGPDEQRWYSKTNQYPSTSREVVYAGDYEKVSDSWTVEPAREFYYLDGNTIVVRENGKYKYFLAFTDNIGSILSVIDENGVKVFDASYDAWGRQTVTRNDIGLLRGYTGHEMIPELEIINMNGRLYDPVLGRFFSPDNYVQMPENSQSFNRYSYCLNNPLKYNDPSGEIFGFIGGLIRGTFKLFTKGDFLAPFKESWNGLKLDFKVFGGLYVGDFKQLVSRYTWESLQTSIGFFYSEFSLLVHDVDAVEYYDGATFVINKHNGNGGYGVTIGSYINISERGVIPYDEHGNFAPYMDGLYMHEYGHYIQSQEYGFGYLFSVGIPSLWDLTFGDGKGKTSDNYQKHDLKWFERSANAKAYKHFEGLYGKWDYKNYPIEYPH